jgi:hypothetical protein
LLAPLTFITASIGRADAEDPLGPCNSVRHVPYLVLFEYRAVTLHIYNIWGKEPSRNRVVVPACQATWAGGRW